VCDPPFYGLQNKKLYLNTLIEQVLNFIEMGFGHHKVLKICLSCCIGHYRLYRSCL